MPDRNSFNEQVIAEFRANNGIVGGQFEGMSVLLLHHEGARTGIWRVNPLAFQSIGDDFAIFASKGGAPTNPDWYHNLVAHPLVKIEVGSETLDVEARTATGSERDEIWERQKALAPGFAAYEASAGREIPVVVLHPTS